MLFQSGVEEAFKCKPPLQLFEGMLQRPVALRLQRLYQKLGTRGGKTSSRPGASTCTPSCGLNRRNRRLFRKQTHCSCAS